MIELPPQHKHLVGAKFISHRGMIIPVNVVLVHASSHRQRDHLSAYKGVWMRAGPIDTTCPMLDCNQSVKAIYITDLDDALRIKGVRQIKRPRTLIFYGGFGSGDNGARDQAKAMGIVETET